MSDNLLAELSTDELLNLPPLRGGGWEKYFVSNEVWAEIRRRLDRLAKCEAALKPFAEFGKYAEEHPRSGLDDSIYGWDNEVFIRLRDLMAARAALEGK